MEIFDNLLKRDDDVEEVCRMLMLHITRSCVESFGDGRQGAAPPGTK